MAKVVKRNGKWVLDYYENGYRKRLSFDTKLEANNLLNQVKLKALGLLEVKEESVSIPESIRTYYETVSVKKSERSYKLEQLMFERLYDYLFDIHGLSFIGEIKQFHLEGFQNHLCKEFSLTGASVNRYFNTIRSYFNKCLEWGLIAKDPCHFLNSLPVDEKPRQLWTNEVFKSVLLEVPKWVGDILIFISLTGARSGVEVKQLKWSDIDFNNGTISLKSYKGQGNVRHRLIPMSEQLRSFLLEHKLEAKKAFRAKAIDHVFLNESGNPIVVSSFGRIVSKACDRIGHKGLVAYGLRHTVLTNMSLNNVSGEKIRRIAGHSNQTTTQRYLKHDVSDLSDAFLNSDLH